MQYEITGGTLPILSCRLTSGEQMICERGAMGWMTPGIKMETRMEGGLMGGLSRAISGESMFLVTYTCQTSEAIISFPSCFPGNILPFELKNGNTLIAQKRAFLTSEKSVNISVFFNKKIGAGLFGGEGFIMQKFEGDGMLFLEIDGSVSEYDLQAGQELLVDTGCVAAFEESVKMDIETVKGLKNIVFGGEGLFLTHLTGPGKVYLQSMPISNFAQVIGSVLPHK